MGLLGWIIGAGAAGFVLRKVRQETKETGKRNQYDPYNEYTEESVDQFLERIEAENAERQAARQRRRNTPCRFIDGFTEDEFEQMVKQAGNNIKRLSDITVDGPFVSGKVKSQSGLSTWDFELDFNDFGHITGEYWIFSDNDDSSIPKVFGDAIQKSINDFSVEDFYENDIKTESKEWENLFCPYCGKQQTVSHALFCGYCGKKLR